MPALKLGHSLRKLSYSLVSEALQTENKELKQRGDALRTLYEMDQSAMTTRQTLTCLHLHKFNNAKCLPLANDIKLLNLHLPNKAEPHLANLNHDTLQ